jgi:hypothetical protein
MVGVAKRAVAVQFETTAVITVLILLVRLSFAHEKLHPALYRRRIRSCNISEDVADI